MKLVTVQRIAEELSVSERHVREMIAKGRWPIYRVGTKRLRLDPDEIRNVCRLTVGPKTK